MSSSSASTSDSLSYEFDLPDGYRIRVFGAHGHTHWQIRAPKRRIWSTSREANETTALHGRRIAEIAALAPATRRSA